MKGIDLFPFTTSFMKKLLSLFAAATLSVTAVTSVFADTWVNGYTRSDGSYVQGHYRSSPNSTVRDNYIYKGNSNPYTGETGSNYYCSSPSSEYYQPDYSTPSISLPSIDSYQSGYSGGSSLYYYD